ncbi:MAG: F0F1 ATP synthase subunit B [Candidatus Moraniibacteriota bacterium]|jgi:F-type H+-transporting ATPase subunit b
MNELLTSLGIDWRLFSAQLINFSILLLILYKFAYAPVLKMLDDRAGKIEKGLADAEKSQKKLKEIEKKEKKVLVEAKKQAKEILKKAEDQAQANKEELTKIAQKESDKIVEKAKKVASEEKDKMVADVKSEISVLVATAVEKIVDEKINDTKDAQIINDVIS